MSYDLILYRTKPGVALNVVAEAEEPAPGRPDERPLLALTPQEIAQIEDAIGALPGPWERDALEEGIELTHDASGPTVFQVELGPKAVSIRIPFGSTAPEKQAAAVWDALRVLQARGLRVWDPQADAEIDPDSGRAAFVSSFIECGSVVSRAFVPEQGSSAPPNGPSWRVMGIGGAAIAVAVVLIAIRMRRHP